MELKFSKQPHSDHHFYIEGIRNNDGSIFEELYKKDLAAHTKWVRANSGDANDAFDNFQDAMEVIIKKANSQSFILCFPFKLFLHGVAHKLWYKKLKKRKNAQELVEVLVRKMQQDEYINKEEFGKLLEHTIDGDRWEKLKERTFQKISTLCQKLLTLDKEGKTINEIKDELEMKSNTIHRRRSACKMSWRKAMEADPDFKNCNPYNI